MPAILVVDDDRAIQEMLADVLHESGYQAETCRDGRKVIPHLEARPFDLIILDVLIPHINGFTLIEQIRAHPAYREIPVIMISGIYRGRNHRDDMIKRFQVLDYLDKPLSIEQLTGLVEEAVGPGDPESLVEIVEEPATPEEQEKAEQERLKRVTVAPPQPANEMLVDQDAQNERREVEHDSVADFQTSAFLLQGSLKRNTVAAVLGKLWHNRRSGGLLLRYGKTKKIIYVHEGSAYWVKSNLVSECLGQLLVSERMISEDECARSIQLMKESGKKQGEILVGMRSLTPKNLGFSLELQHETKLFETFTWKAGEFRFNASARRPDASVGSEWQGAKVVIEGVRRAFDETRLRELMLPILDVPLAFRESDHEMGGLGFEPHETEAVLDMKLPSSTRDLIDSMGLDPPDTLRVVFTLIALELLGPKP